MKTATERAKQCKTMLADSVHEGDTIFTVLRHVSASGMQRTIDCFVKRDNRPFYLSGYMEGIGIAKRKHRQEGLVVNGCGMDMGFDLVYRLSYELFGKGNALRHEWL